jgi:alkylation response protein AidB-like acyl-CoA dehydrogenase
MTNYASPVKDMKFALDYIVDYDEIMRYPGNEEATADMVQAILDEAARFATNLLAPINQSGDQQGSRLSNGEVQTPDGFHEAYQQFMEAGWMGLPFPQRFGGQGLPWILGAMTQEMWDGANMSWGLCSILSRGAVELMIAHASDEQKSLYLEKMVAGQWSGTMNLTESHAGSDLGSIKTMATPDGDHHLLKGQKIFITWGEQDLTENIIHLVLARTPDAPAGPRGVSLFIVPKFLLDKDGEISRRNDVKCVALEKKLGIKGSATCVMSYGEEEGAVGYLVGEEGRGIPAMFTMMNNERLAVSLQSIAVADRAYQLALSYAKERVQSRSAVESDGPGAVTIIHHADVRRMLLSMRSRIEAGRALCYYAMAAIDKSHGHPDESERVLSRARVDLLTPIVKNWCTEYSNEVANLGIQVHGGAGFIEETGAAQHLRDTRICSIYEGTSGIQANDLVSRKVLADGGKEISRLMDEIDADLARYQATDAASCNAHLRASLESIGESNQCLRETTEWILENGKLSLNRVVASAHHFSMFCGNVISSWLLARGITNALESGSEELSQDDLNARIAVLRFQCEQFLTQSAGMQAIILHGDDTIMSLTAEQF